MGILVDFFDWVVCSTYFRFFASENEREEEARFQTSLQRSRERTFEALEQMERATEKLHAGWTT